MMFQLKVLSMDKLQDGLNHDIVPRNFDLWINFCILIYFSIDL